MITIVDYDAGNLRSVSKAFERLGHPCQISSSWRDLLTAGGVVLPGVGAAGAAMRNLHQRDLVGALKEVVASGKPFLGVCLGLQVCMDASEEDGGVECLGLLPGLVRRIPAAPGIKVPHMGWNSVELRLQHSLLDTIDNFSYFYFVHSYYVDPADEAAVVGTTEHGVRFASVVASENLFATQFHPEKSGADGLRIYDNFARLCARLAQPATIGQ